MKVALTFRLLLAAAASLLIGLSAGCDEDKGRLIPNKPPEVLLTAAPPDSGETGYDVEFYWEGRDADGEVDHFIYAVDPPDMFSAGDSVWIRTDAYSGSFAFRAVNFDTLYHWSDPQIAKSWHLFVIKAVDDMGAVSEPDYVAFNATTVAPRTRFTTPEPGGGIEDYMGSPQHVGLKVTFRWEGDDPDGAHAEEPVGYFFKTVDVTGKRKNELASSVWEDTTEWIERGANDRKMVVTLDDARNYAIAVRGIDEAGAIEPLLLVNGNLLWVGAREGFSYPELTLRSTALGSRTWQGWGVSPEVYEVPVGSRYEIAISANAGWYGGVITGFSYGWDMQDLESNETDPEGMGAWTPWSTFNTTITAEFTEGRDYFLHVRCKDDGGGMTLATVRFRVIQLDPKYNLCYIDDWRKYDGNPAYAEPLDDQVWQTMLEGYNYGEDWADVSWDEWEAGYREQMPSLEFLSQFRVLVWSLMDNRSLALNQQSAWFVMNKSSTLHVLAVYMTGSSTTGERGKVWAFGRGMVESSLLATLGDLCEYPYPVDHDMSLDTPCVIGSRTFASEFMHITGEFDDMVLNSGGTRISRLNRTLARVFVDTAGPSVPDSLYTRPPAAELYPSLPNLRRHHSSYVRGWPYYYFEILEYPEPDQEEQHIFYDPELGQMTGLIPLYRVHLRNQQSAMHNKYCGFRYIPSKATDHGEMVYFFFPMFTFEDEDIRAAAKVVLSDWFGLPDPDLSGGGAERSPLVP